MRCDDGDGPAGQAPGICSSRSNTSSRAAAEEEEEEEEKQRKKKRSLKKEAKRRRRRRKADGEVWARSRFVWPGMVAVDVNYMDGWLSAQGRQMEQRRCEMRLSSGSQGKEQETYH